MSNANRQDRLDRATAARLSKLAGRQINTQSVEEWVEQSLQPPVMQKPVRVLAWRPWWRPISAAAAILIAVVVGWMMLDGATSPAMASPTELARIHFDVANGLAPHLKVSSVAEANRLLAEQSGGALPVFELPGEVRSCCLHQYAATTLTCVLIERDGHLVTVAIAEVAKLHSPEGKTMTRDGRVFVAHTANGINMVMAHKGTRWLCVMGDVPTDELVAIASEIQL